MSGEVNSGGLPIIAAAHELKAPLALMRQLALTLDGEMSDSDRRELARQIRLSSEKALRLTSDLTRSARLDDALFELEPINPVELCRDIVTELKPLMDAHKRTINVFAHKKHPLLLVANRDLLRRIVVNFTDNAMRYSDPDTTIDLAISTLSRGKTVRVAVRDYGPALRREVRRSMRSGHESAAPMSGRPESSGLGIYLAGRFAESMGGKIGAISHHDGATFYVDLHASSQLSLL